MDPTACLERILHAISIRDTDELVYAAQDLADWMVRGGFAPDMRAAMAAWDRWASAVASSREVPRD